MLTEHFAKWTALSLSLVRPSAPRERWLNPFTGWDEIRTFVSTPVHAFHDSIPMQDLRLADRRKMQKRRVGVGSVGLKLVEETFRRGWRGGARSRHALGDWLVYRVLGKDV